MISKKRLYLHLLQTIISWEASISTPATSSWLRILCLKAMGVKVEGPIWVGEHSVFISPHNLSLGKAIAIGEFSRIVSYAPVSIGDNFLSSGGLYIDSATHDAETLLPSGGAITIGKRVWCGMRVTICAGVTIGDDVVIGAGAVVTKSLPSGCIAVGVPAKPIRTIDRSDISKLWSWAS